MNAVARAELLSRPHLRRGSDYGFDSGEVERIRAEFPQVEILYNLDRNRMEVWAIGEYGALPNRVIDNVPRDDMYRLLDCLRQMKYDAANYRPGQYGDEVRAQLDREQKDAINEATDTLDPDFIKDAYLQSTEKKVRPVSVPSEVRAA